MGVNDGSTPFVRARIVYGPGSTRCCDRFGRWPGRFQQRMSSPVKPRPTVRVIKAHALRAPSELYKRSVRKPRVKHGGVSVFGTEATGISSQRFLPKAGRGTHQDARHRVSQRRGYTAVSATTLGGDGNHHRTN